MRDWLTYRLSDLLLFSPRTYYRMFELYHQDIWPGQLLSLSLAVVILVLFWRDDEWSGRAIAGLLAMWWLWVGVAFHLYRYATINWAARYFAVLFVLEAVLLVWSGVARRRVTFRLRGGHARWLAGGVFVVAIATPPLAGLVEDRTWRQVELVGLTPDATAVATLALLVLCAPRPPRVLILAPVAWCAIGGATLWALESSEAWVLIVAGVVSLLVMLVRLPAARDGQSFQLRAPVRNDDKP